MRAVRSIVIILGMGLGMTGATQLSHAAGGEWVVVSATAAPEYHRTKGPEGVLPESYVFTPGIHFGGSARDATQEKMPFLTIAQTLSAGLARQRYLPAKDPANAKLVIVVHWGSTETYEDPNRQTNLESLHKELTDYIAQIQQSGIANPGPLNALLSNQQTDAMRQLQFINANAELLGYRRSLLKEGERLFSSEEENTMRSELAEERYFVVLMAYDYQLLKKEKKPRLLWVTRMSVRSPGNNFAEAVPGMTRVAADFFGQQHEDLTRVQTKLPEGKVEIGELKVVDGVSEIVKTPKAP
jgi:hypothetical protein